MFVVEEEDPKSATVQSDPETLSNENDFADPVPQIDLTDPDSLVSKIVYRYSDVDVRGSPSTSDKIIFTNITKGADHDNNTTWIVNPENSKEEDHVAIATEPMEQWSDKDGSLIQRDTVFMEDVIKEDSGLQLLQRDSVFESEISLFKRDRNFIPKVTTAFAVGSILIAAVLVAALLVITYRNRSKSPAIDNAIPVQITKEDVKLTRIHHKDQERKGDNSSSNPTSSRRVSHVSEATKVSSRHGSQATRKLSRQFIQGQQNIGLGNQVSHSNKIVPRARAASISEDGLSQGAKLAEFLKRNKAGSPVAGALPHQFKDNFMITLDEEEYSSSADSSTNSLDSTDEVVDTADSIQDIQEVVVAWLPHRFDELALSVGDKVVVHRVYEDGWCDGKIYGSEEEGAFPLECLKCHAQQMEAEDDNVLQQESH